ncbi:MAG: adenosylmethionine decarboxylase [Zestosphaera sp.]
MGLELLTHIGGKNIKTKVYGRHVYGSLYECDSELLSDPEFLKKVVIEAAHVGNMTLLDVRTWYMGPGVSVVAIILESHISIHTWPEYSFATVDVYSCGKHTDPLRSFEYIVRALRARRYEFNMIDRSLT